MEALMWAIGLLVTIETLVTSLLLPAISVGVGAGEVVTITARYFCA